MSKKQKKNLKSTEEHDQEQECSFGVMFTGLTSNEGYRHTAPEQESHPIDCGWHQDWHNCDCGLFVN